MQVEEDRSIVLKELENEIGFPVQGYAPGTTVVPEKLKFPEKKLRSYLNWVLKIHSKGDEGLGIQYYHLTALIPYNFYDY